MSLTRSNIDAFVAAHAACMLVEVGQSFGSVPREADTWMLVSEHDILGTIGGGQLEFLAIDHARRLMAGDQAVLRLDIPLGPDIGQCCGGRVVLDFAPLDNTAYTRLCARVEKDRLAQTHIYVFGAGHVGRALAETLAPLPVRVQVVDTRLDQLSLVDVRVATHRTPMPESVVRNAPNGSVFIAVTHDHALDFMISGEALSRQDALYVGMIGSKTKRAQFKRWYLSQGGNNAALSELVCPIGSTSVKDKRPEIIAVLTAAEVIERIDGRLRNMGETPEVSGVLED